MASLDQWAAKQDDEPSRSEAIRRLVELGLNVKGEPRKSSESQKARAREMAGKAIDGMTYDDANAEDQAGRKRRLLKGPEEFREVRIDRKRK